MATVVPLLWLVLLLGLTIPPDSETVLDGRAPIQSLYSSYLGLQEMGWHLDVIAESQPAGTDHPLPIIALRSPRAGPAVWFLSGIHGEEPAGPNALSQAIDDIAALGERRPVVLIPLCNPHGYARNWRYLNVPVYSETIEGQSVGDSSHLLPDSEDPAKARAARASSPEALALTDYVIRMAEKYPPVYSIDLHEDNLLSESYVYSQGVHGAGDPLAIEAVQVLQKQGIPIKAGGETRFGERIKGGVIGPVTDSSIDELMSTNRIVVDGQARTGPSARTVLAFELPTEHLTLEQRVAAYLSLIKRLSGLISASP